MKALILLLAPKTLIDLTIQLDPSLPTIFSLHVSEAVKNEAVKTASYLCCFSPATSPRLLASL